MNTELFQFYAPLRMSQEPGWISVTDLMKDGIDQFVNQVQSNPNLVADIGKYIGRLNRITTIKDVELHAEDVTGEDKTVDMVVDIFNRVNSGGTKLSKGDLALAKICADWPQARSEMNARLGKWRKAGFSFRLEWLLRCINSLVTGEAAFSAFKNVTTPEFRDGLLRSERHVDYLLNLISSRLGLDHDRVLGSPYSFPLMVRYIDKRGGKLTDPKERGGLLYWYVQTIIWGRYSGNTEATLNQDLEAIEENSGALERLLERLRRNRGNLRVTPSDFSGWSIGARFYPLLYMLTRTHHSRDWCSGIELSNHMLGKLSHLQLHHIFPKSKLNNDDYQRSEVNALANFTFLTQECNLEVSNRDPAEYIPNYLAKQPGVIESHWIPINPKLWKFENYRGFLAARRELLAQAANEFLDNLREGGVPEVESNDLVSDGTTAMSSASASGDEEEILLNANIWITEQGLPEGDFQYQLADETTGELLAILDLAWPHGLQEGLSQPVALLIDEDAETEKRASEAGFRFYTNTDSLKKYVEEQILATSAAV